MRTLKYFAFPMLLVGSLLAAHVAQASPGFARQTGLACNTCHFQHFPALNSFGRAFKQEAYTLKGKQEPIEGENLSIAGNLNIGLVTKLRYIRTNGTDPARATNTGEIQFPDEAALLIGGRAGENVGFLVEASLIDSVTSYNSFRIHYNNKATGVNLGVVPFLTDAGGAPYGMEILNTGAQRFIRIAENRTATAAQQFIQGATGERPGGSAATGFAFVASAPQWFANFTLWHPNFGTNIAHGQFANYFRAAYMPTIGSWDTAIGMQHFSGSSVTGAPIAVEVDTKASFVDAQAQGAIGSVPVGLYLTWGKADGSPAVGTANYFNAQLNDQKAWSFVGEVGVIPNRSTVYVGYLNGDNGRPSANEDRRATLGLTWMLAQNLELQMWNTWARGNRYSGAGQPTGDNETGFMLFAGF